MQSPLPAAAWLALSIAGAACGTTATPAAASCPAGGELAVELYGDLRATLAWQGAQLDCDGMPRPGGQGARLRFAGPAPGDDDARLAFIVALPDLQPGRADRELPATVTFMAEDSGRFYSNRESGICWADVTAQQALADAQYAISGIVYCIAPLAALGGDGGVTLQDLRFSGVVDWRGQP